MIQGITITSPKKQRKNAISNGCVACAATRIRTLITTAQIPLSRIHSAARVVGASLGAVKVTGRQSPSPGPAAGSAERHREDNCGQFHPRVLLSDAGV
jgi:hypothetical protein